MSDLFLADNIPSLSAWWFLSWPCSHSEYWWRGNLWAAVSGYCCRMIWWSRDSRVCTGWPPIDWIGKTASHEWNAFLNRLIRNYAIRQRMFRCCLER